MAGNGNAEQPRALSWGLRAFFFARGADLPVYGSGGSERAPAGRHTPPIGHVFSTRSPRSPRARRRGPPPAGGPGRRARRVPQRRAIRSRAEPNKDAAAKQRGEDANARHPERPTTPQRRGHTTSKDGDQQTGEQPTDREAPEPAEAPGRAGTRRKKRIPRGRRSSQPSRVGRQQNGSAAGMGTADSQQNIGELCAKRRDMRTPEARSFPSRRRAAAQPPRWPYYGHLFAYGIFAHSSTKPN